MEFYTHYTLEDTRIVVIGHEDGQRFGDIDIEELSGANDSESLELLNFASRLDTGDVEGRAALLVDYEGTVEGGVLLGSETELKDDKKRIALLNTHDIWVNTETIPEWSSVVQSLISQALLAADESGEFVRRPSELQLYDKAMLIGEGLPLNERFASLLNGRWVLDEASVSRFVGFLRLAGTDYGRAGKKREGPAGDLMDIIINESATGYFTNSVGNDVFVYGEGRFLGSLQPVDRDPYDHEPYRVWNFNSPYTRLAARGIVAPIDPFLAICKALNPRV